MNWNIRKPSQGKVIATESIVKNNRDWVWYIAGIIALTVIVYLPSLKNAFTNWDDPYYVTDIGLIRNLSLQTIKTFFSTYVADNYHPLTMLSLAVNYKLSGLNPEGYHITNLLLHLCNILLVFVFIRKLSGDWRIAAITSLLFSIHPMHVESVAWVSERKDVLFTFFYLLALCVYVDYVNAPKLKLYFAVFILYILSLLSKGMAVTLPLVLLLVDYYKGRKFNTKSFFEKIPFIMLSIVFGVIAIYAQHSTQALESNVGVSYFDRIIFASYAMVIYLWKAIFPFHLSCFYDYPIKTNGYYPFIFYLSPIILIVLGYLIYKLSRKNKNAGFAALFFIFTIGIVLQLLPVGKAIIAERYTYVPYIGLSFLAGKGIVSITGNKNMLQSIRVGVISAFAIVTLIFTWLTYQQCYAWKNSLTLWTEVINNSPSALAYCNRGQYFMESGNNDEAIADFTKSIEMRDYVAAYLNRSSVYLKMGLVDKALDDCNKMISLSPDNAYAYNTKGECLNEKKEYTESVEAVDKAIQLKPDYDLPCYTKGNALNSLGKYDEAIIAFNSAININSRFKEAYNNRSVAYFEKKEYAKALTDVLKAKELGFNVNVQYLQFLSENK